MSARVAADIGGTFTDIAISTGNNWFATKIVSTPQDFTRGVLEGIEKALAVADMDAADVTQFVHAYTIATNALLEGTGAPVSLITTEGFRDVLELRRIRMPRLFDLAYRKPPALVPRHRRYEVSERLNYRGEVLVPLGRRQVEGLATAIAASGVESVAVCLIHAWANPVHEQLLQAWLAELLPSLDITISSDLLPEMREYERTSTAVVNAYIKPIVAGYLEALVSALGQTSLSSPVQIMQSSGGLATLDATTRRPVFSVESGPAAGVLGAQRIGTRIGERNLITLDIGGTTAKAAMIENGELTLAPEYEVGGGLNVGTRMLRGGGYLIRTPSVDVAEVGAGGGSIAQVDGAGSLKVGPRSAGSNPGPACYGFGGQSPTVTDANVVLGYIDQEALLGGSFPIRRDLAERAIKSGVAEPLAMSLLQAAYGVHLLANATMARALRAVSSERGRDPRSFALFAFGGGGPLHAAGLAEILGTARIIIPPQPGSFSAYGLLCADVNYHFVRTLNGPLDGLSLMEANARVAELRDEAEDALEAAGIDLPNRDFQLYADLRYVGQPFEITVPVEAPELTASSLGAVAERFEAEHERTYGYRSGGGFQLGALRLVARDRGRHAEPDQGEIEIPQSGQPASRPAYFGESHEWVQTPVYRRTSLGAQTISGPAIIEEYGASTLIPPHWLANQDASTNLILTRSP